MLKAHGTKDVVFSITPHDTGRQTYNISVMNMKTMTPVRSRRSLVPRDPASHQLLISYYDFLPPPQRIVSVTLSVEKSRGLRYPDLVTGKADLYNLSSTGRFVHFFNSTRTSPRRTTQLRHRSGTVLHQWSSQRVRQGASVPYPEPVIGTHRLNVPP